jgi:hypothetical protein
LGWSEVGRRAPWGLRRRWRRDAHEGVGDDGHLSEEEALPVAAEFRQLFVRFADGGKSFAVVWRRRKLHELNEKGEVGEVFGHFPLGSSPSSTFSMDR